MRKSFYSLSGIVANKMRRNIQDGDAFVFVNRSLDSMKILHAEFSGPVIYNLKLEKGRINLPDTVFDGEGKAAVSHLLGWSELVLMAQGICPSDVRRKPRWIPQEKGVKTSLKP